MRGKTNLYLIDGKPVLVPDEGVSESYEDLDSDASGRDQSGIMHRSLIREKVGTWGFSYASLTAEEWKYSFLKEKIEKWFHQGLWTEAMVRNSVGVILSPEEAEKIIHSKLPEV